MRTLKESIKMHESILDIDSNLEKDDINQLVEEWLSEHTNLKKGDYNIDNNYNINAFIDVRIRNNDDDVMDIPDYIQFNTVRGNFSIMCDVKSLKGCPRECRVFGCRYNDTLTSLVGCPQKVETINISDSKLISSLEGCPEKISGDLICKFCSNLEDLRGAPKEIGGNLDLRNCKSFIKFNNAIKKVGGDLLIVDSNLATVSGMPKISGDLYIANTPISWHYGKYKDKLEKIVKGHINTWQAI